MCCFFYSEIVVRKLKSDWNRAGTTSLLVKWERPYGHIAGYNVYYKAFEVASLTVSNTTLNKFALNENSTRVQIFGLETFTRYNITVTPIGREGLRVISSYTLAGKYIVSRLCLYKPYIGRGGM